MALPRNFLRSRNQRALIPGWRLAAQEVLSLRPHVTISPRNIPEILAWLTPGPPNDAWRAYASPVKARAPDLDKLFFELALTISQFGGFVAYRADGGLDSWKQDGSGVKAVLATMAEIRKAKRLPCIDVRRDLDRELAHFFIRTPFGRQRLDMLKEVGNPAGRRYFRELLRQARRRDGSYRFNTRHMKELAKRFPLSFGEDPIFYKKASLLLMTMEIALNQLGATAVAATLPPADYRIPQILEGVGILKYKGALATKITNGHIFRLHDPEVLAVRAATVEAVGLIKDRYEQAHGKETTCAEIDGLLYLLSRNRPLMSRRTMKPHMLVATAAF